MPTIIETKAFSFDELTDAAKNKARDWFREATGHDSYEFEFEFEFVTDDFVTVGNILGVAFDTHSVRLMNGKTRSEPNIYWSGFCSQGDGACFEGLYDYAPGAPAKIREHAPEDRELHRIADELTRLQTVNLFGLQASVKQESSHYDHENTVSIDVLDLRDEDRTVAEADEVDELMRDLMRWFYARLDEHNDYINSDEYIDESIEANEYLFDEDGGRHHYA